MIKTKKIADFLERENQFFLFFKSYNIFIKIFKKNDEKFDFKNVIVKGALSARLGYRKTTIWPPPIFMKTNIKCVPEEKPVLNYETALCNGV